VFFSLHKTSLKNSEQRIKHEAKVTFPSQQPTYTYIIKRKRREKQAWWSYIMMVSSSCNELVKATGLKGKKQYL